MSRCAEEFDFGPPLGHGDWRARAANGAEEMAHLLALRALALRGDAALDDTDRHDADCLHLWIGRAGGGPLATLRLQHHTGGASLTSGYCANFFDLRRLADAPGTTLELGRLCLHARAAQASTMRLVWAAIARAVDCTGAARLIGCTSLFGTEVSAHRPVLAHLAAHHLAPPHLRPPARGGEAFSIIGQADAAESAGARLPPILRSYMAMGGWVSDAVVIDRDLGTCLIFTCVEVARMRPRQRRLLDTLARTEPPPPAEPA